MGKEIEVEVRNLFEDTYLRIDRVIVLFGKFGFRISVVIIICRRESLGGLCV